MHQSHPSRLRAAFCLLTCASATALVADTVHMKNGGVIKDCRILKEENDTVHLRTPGGRMGVPRGVISRIEKEKSVFDEFDDLLARVRATDAAALFKLAQWCRQTGLREEEREILSRVIAANTDHPQARHLLGYYKSGSDWKRPPPLSLTLKTGSRKESEEDFRGQISIVVMTRQDIELASGPPPLKSLDRCELSLELLSGASAEAKFYGQTIRGPTNHSTITITATQDWLEKKPPPVVLKGEVSAKIPDAPRLSIIDAFTRSQKELHNLFDVILEARLQRLEGPAASAPASTPGLAPKKDSKNKKSA